MVSSCLSDCRALPPDKLLWYLHHHISWALGCWWGYDPGMVLATWESLLIGLEDQKGPWTTGAFVPSPELYNWIHKTPLSLYPWLISGSQPLSSGLPLLCSLTYHCYSRVWPTRRQQMPNCNEESFSFSGQNKNLKHWKFHSRACACEVSRPWELPIIQLSFNHLKANLSSILALNSVEFTSHYPLASAVLSSPALLTWMHFGGIKSGTAPDLFHRKVCSHLLHLLEVSQNITTSRHPRGCTKHLSV